MWLCIYLVAMVLFCWFETYHKDKINPVTVVIMVSICFAMRFIAPFIVPFLLFFAEKYETQETLSYLPPVKRLPWWCSWFDTPDCLLPGDLLEEPAMKDIYDKWGWFVAAYVWIGFRNVFDGFSWEFGKPCCNYLSNMTDSQKKNYGVYEKVISLGPFKLLVGHAAYKDRFNVKTIPVGHNEIHRDQFWAVPRISLRFADQV